MQNDWQDAFKDLLEGFCTGFKGKHPNRDFLWRRSLKTWKINTLHLQKCGHFCLKGLKCQECRQPSSRGCSDFTHLLFQLWALSKERKAQGGAAPISAVSRISTGGADSAGEPWWSQVWMRNPEWWISVLCRTHNLLDGHWPLPAPISALTSGRGDVKCAVAGRTALSITQAASSRHQLLL